MSQVPTETIIWKELDLTKINNFIENDTDNKISLEESKTTKATDAVFRHQPTNASNDMNLH